jgi:hypothetical protein
MRSRKEQDIGGEAALRATLQDFYKQEIRALSRRRQRRAVYRLCEEYLISPQGRRLSIDGNEIHRQLKLSGEVLGKLVNRRLLRSDQRADSTYYQLSHDTLLEPVMTTRRVKRRFLGSLVVCAGALLLLASVVSTLGVLLMPIGVVYERSIKAAKSETLWYIRFSVIGTLIFFVAISSFRWGVRTFRRYRSHG